jgi:hypothetical protein
MGMEPGIVVNAVGPFLPNAICELTIVAESNSSVSWDGPKGINNPELATTQVVLPAEPGAYDYKVTVKVGEKPAVVKERRLVVSDASRTESPTEFDPFFAGIGLIVCVVGGFLVVTPIWRAIRDVHPQGTIAVQGPDVGAVVAFGLLLIGIVIIVSGLFLAAIEARGRMSRKAGSVRTSAAPATGDWAAVIDALGKLRGSALVLVIGCIPLLAAAWIGKTSVEQTQVPNADNPKTVVSGETK